MSLALEWAGMAIDLGRIARSFAPVVATDERVKGALRPDQEPPEGDWSTWLLLGGRGSGKTLSLVNVVCEWAEEFPGCRIGLGARTAADVRDTIIYGKSGFMSMAARPPRHVEQKRRLEWPNGSFALLLSADEPRQGRGPNFHFAACDELMAWHRPERPGSLWHNIKLATRLPAEPGWKRRPGARTVVATTPLPNPLLRQMVEKASATGPIRMSRLKTKDNAANLAEEFLDEQMALWEGTHWGRQELDGELLDEAEGAFWSRERNLDPFRVHPADVPPLVEKIVSVDPTSGGGEEHNDECGITVQGVDEAGHVYTLDDRTLRGPPEVWAQAAVDARDAWGCDLIVAEGNQGGQMVRTTIWGVDPEANVVIVHARDGKRARAMPVAVVYDKGFAHHVGPLKELEDQLTAWSPYGGGASPNRLDALVWGVTYFLPHVHLAMTRAAKARREAERTSQELRREQSHRDAEAFRKLVRDRERRSQRMPFG